MNNLGATTALEMGVAAAAAAAVVCSSPSPAAGGGGLGARLERLYVGTFVSSLNMHGLSITLLRLSGGGGDGSGCTVQRRSRLARVPGLQKCHWLLLLGRLQHAAPRGPSDERGARRVGC